MKIKILKNIKKYWDYIFDGDKIIMRRKCDGHLKDFDSIRQFISYYIGENFGFNYQHSWQKSKTAIDDARRWKKLQSKHKINN